MLAALLLFAQTPGKIERDSYGVPIIRANSVDEAWRLAGRAVAEDRLWQMELSRRLARGQLAELLGRSGLASDQEVLKTAYTDAELRQQFEGLQPDTKAMIRAYVDGVNEVFSRPPDGAVPITGYHPAPWTIEDSVAISIRLFQLFGRGGAGELRNLALLQYLRSRPNLKGKEFDVFDDFAWQNDPKSPTTVDGGTGPDIFPKWTRRDAEAQLAALPNVGLMELLPAIRTASREDSSRVAQQVNVAYKTGSYAVVVSPSRSATGYPILLSAPQMGFQNPSVVHEISVHAPGLDVAGMDVPGVPGVAIGATPDIAWGLTSGVADIEDVVWARGATPERIEREIAVKDGSPVKSIQLRALGGPVLLQSKDAVFVRRASYWMNELASLDVFSSLYRAKSADDVEAATRRATMTFNFFYATRSGDVGYRYLGRVPLRPAGYDPRFPIPASASWRGTVPFEAMPHERNPKSGLITNWNNKPAAWWPNGDTPVWGEIFRVSALRDQLTKPKLNTQDVELAAWAIARTDETWPFFRPFVEPKPEAVRGFEGRLLDGSLQAAAYGRFLDNLRNEVFADDVGNFLSPEYFRLIVQPSVILRALRRQTKVDYLNGAKPSDLVAKALAPGEMRRYRPGSITVTDETPIPYSNRGTYIQVIELLASGVLGRNVLPPGVAERGPHARDQAPLARAWTYKPMTLR